MKKAVLHLSIATVLALCSLLSGCGGGAAPAASPPPGEASAETPGDTASAGEVELTMGSWRTDDVAQMNAFLAEYKKVAPNVTIKFQPTNPPDYNATLRLQLESGTGPDIMYARSYATGQELFESGYIADCSDIPGITENFTPANREAWQTPDGKMFAVPFAAVSHAVYYNKDIFAAEGITVPNTWAEFMAACQRLKDRGVTPLANGVADEWDILECFFLGMLPNYVGGADQRLLYESGEKKMNDEAFVAAYTDMAGVTPYLPDGFEAVTYNDSQVMFNTQSAAMFVDGSWTLGVYEGAPFNWGVFAIPARNAADTAIAFHPDAALTMNTATAHPEEARAFLEWIASEEGARTAAQYLPTGFFPMANFSITLANPQANEFLALNEGRVTDARFVWPQYMDLYAPMNQEIIALLKGATSPQQAADAVAALVQ